ncbi:GPI-anchored surface protein, putative [Bodo saltans]|uniref:GPI-anchored surface protein, putative n=1 Tax=Bodo saltans TaxID=75058 RepID=A0A0S4IJU4_BODSA|nr:GPI-anchored surface protein, putative [Bodo saltans]|eukprot:CUE60348.1 GPI-anchored surface protein, putative [Bodo saltans]
MLNSDLRSVMVEVDHSMWTGAPPPTIALRTLGATSALIKKKMGYLIPGVSILTLPL